MASCRLSRMFKPRRSTNAKKHLHWTTFPVGSADLPPFPRRIRILFRLLSQRPQVIRALCDYRSLWSSGMFLIPSHLLLWSAWLSVRGPLGGVQGKGLTASKGGGGGGGIETYKYGLRDASQSSLIHQQPTTKPTKATPFNFYSRFNKSITFSDLLQSYNPF